MISNFAAMLSSDVNPSLWSFIFACSKTARPTLFWLLPNVSITDPTLGYFVCGRFICTERISLVRLVDRWVSTSLRSKTCVNVELEFSLILRYIQGRGNKHAFKSPKIRYLTISRSFQYKAQYEEEQNTTEFAIEQKNYNLKFGGLKEYSVWLQGLYIFHLGLLQPTKCNAEQSQKEGSFALLTLNCIDPPPRILSIKIILECLEEFEKWPNYTLPST